MGELESSKRELTRADLGWWGFATVASAVGFVASAALAVRGYNTPNFDLAAGATLVNIALLGGTALETSKLIDEYREQHPSHSDPNKAEQPPLE